MAGGLKDFPLPQSSRKYVGQFPLPELASIRNPLVDLELLIPRVNDLNLSSLVASFRKQLALESQADVMLCFEGGRWEDWHDQLISKYSKSTFATLLPSVHQDVIRLYTRC